MADIKLVITDVDGTLVLPQKHEVSEKVRQAVIAAEKKGVKVVPVTGRPYEMLKPVATLLGFDSLVVVDNGATIRQAISGELVWSNWLTTEQVKEIVELVLPVSVAIDYAPDWQDHTPSTDLEAEMANITGPAPYVYSAFPKEHLPRIEAALERMGGLAYHFDIFTGRPEMQAVQVTKLEATKFQGVEALREIDNIDIKHTLAIGDGNNDLPLFENAGVKVAMGNASELLKARANHVVSTVTDDGFAEAMDRLVLH